MLPRYLGQWNVVVTTHLQNALTCTLKILTSHAYLDFVIHNYGAISTLCANGCVGLNQVEYGLILLRSIYSVKSVLRDL